MRLLDYMRAHSLDDRKMAKIVGGGCSIYQIKKWKYGEREPPLAWVIRLEKATDGRVTLHDLVRETA